VKARDWVFPVSVSPRSWWSLAIYGQTLASLDFAGGSGGDPPVFIPLSSLTIANLGASAALRLSDGLSVGIGAAVFVANSTEIGVEFSTTPSYLSEDYTSVESGVIAGVLWSLSDAWALGVSYRSGADFRFDSGREATLPDILAAGARWRSAGGHATLAVELERLSGVDDRTRLHLGGEWVFLSVKPLIGLRAGLWHDPGGGVASRELIHGPPADDAVVHASAGIGFAFRRFQLDLGVDSSERTTIASVSAIFTF
jgi:hypothetical protein